MCSEIIIRDADEFDIASIEELIETGYRKKSSTKGWTTEFALIDGDRLQDGEIAAALADNKNKFFVASDNDKSENKIVGVICVTKNNDWIEFGKFTVSPDYQGHGIGKKLMSAVEKYVSEVWKSDNLKLSVITIRQELIDFYARFGFKDTGQRLEFAKLHPYVILKDGVADLEVMIMEKPLLVS